ncbi:hypothetical protein TNCV_3388541 [Trichonephila clavipes]|nr:hypothetical protein TNCV_3388541 [Trichonephila clavipes]
MIFLRNHKTARKKASTSKDADLTAGGLLRGPGCEDCRRSRRNLVDVRGICQCLTFPPPPVSSSILLLLRVGPNSHGRKPSIRCFRVFIPLETRFIERLMHTFYLSKRQFCTLACWGSLEGGDCQLRRCSCGTLTEVQNHEIRREWNSDDFQGCHFHNKTSNQTGE